MSDEITNYSVVSRILVVEDDADQRDWVGRVLESAGFTAEFAKDGGQAHASFTMHKPDFVLLDLILPNESGYEVCERFKRTDPQLPVLIFSEIKLDDSKKLAERVGADGYLEKPVEPDELVSRIREVGEEVWRKHHLADDSKKAAPERILFTCPHCQVMVKVRASYRGRPIPCPKCGSVTQVPR